MGQLDEQEWLTLSCQYRLKQAAQKDPICSILGRDLLNKNTCIELLDSLSPVIGSPSRKITASLLSKRIAFLTTASCLHAMSVFNKGLDLSLDNSIIEYGHDNNLWQSSMPLLDLSTDDCPLGERHKWRKNLCQNLFAENLTPLWQVFSEVSKVSEAILWENTAVRIYSLYERRLVKLQQPELRKRVEEDFHYLINDIENCVFGIKKNPLKQYFHKKIVVKDSEIRFRRTCCFYYKASQPKEYCSTCPLIHPDKRKCHVNHPS